MITDPIQFILTALDDARETQDSSQAKEIYTRLRDSLQKGQNANAVYVLDRYWEKPDIWEAPLKDELTRVQAGQDKELLIAAEKLISIEHVQQQAVFERLLAEVSSLRDTLQKSNKNLLDQFEEGLRFGLYVACISLPGLFGIIILLSEGNIHTGLSLLIIISVVEALSVLFLLRANAISKYVNNANNHLMLAEGIYQKLELVISADDEIRHHLSHIVIEQLLNLSPKNKNLYI
jgi:hypothetical protein